MSNLVTFEQANRLKELGYDNSNSYHFKGVVDGILINEKLPSVSDALDWIREEKVFCWVEGFYYDGINYNGVYVENDSQMTPHKTETFDTHPLASSALLDSILTYLEKKI